MRVLFILICVILISCERGADNIANIGVCAMYAKAEESFYVLPYQANTEHVVTQGNCRPITHFGPQRYAYDFKMNNDTELVAARAGEVMTVKENFPNQPGLCIHGNTLLIKHEDGTVAEYMHLNKDGVIPEVGDSVEQGELVAYSGTSGCTGGFPHLHFVVWQDDWHRWGRGRDSVPISFINAAPQINWGLTDGKSYRAE